MTSVKTPHIVLNDGYEFNKVVIMPGDPKRAEFMAKRFLFDVEVISDVRGNKAFNGYEPVYGRNITIMASGIGQPSISLYSYELFSYFGVDTIIRAGTMGAYQPDLKIGDVVFAMGACTDATNLPMFADFGDIHGTYSAICDYFLLRRAVKVAENEHISYCVGNILAANDFYGTRIRDWKKYGVLGADMETYALYANAAFLGKRALTINVVSDNVLEHTSASVDERETKFMDMMRLAVMTAGSVDWRD